MNYQNENIMREEIALLIMVCAKDGQLKPKTISDRTIDKLIKKGFIYTEKVRNSYYLYPTLEGSKIGQLFFQLGEALLK